MLYKILIKIILNFFDLLQKEENKRQEKIDQWESHLRGEGYYNKSHNVTSSSSSVTSTKKPSGKPKLRPGK